MIMLAWGAWSDAGVAHGRHAGRLHGPHGRFIAPFTTLVTLGATVQEAHGDMNRLDDVLKAELDPQLSGSEGSAAQREAAPKLEGNLEFRGITFGYSPLEKPLIRDFDLEVETGPAGRPGRRLGQRQVDHREAGLRPLRAVGGRDPFRRQARGNSFPARSW